MAQHKHRPPDIEITGQGFYQIEAMTDRATRWMQAVEGFDGRTAYCDDTRLTQNIADGAVCNGLRVEVNGIRYQLQD